MNFVHFGGNELVVFLNFCVESSNSFMITWTEFGDLCGVFEEVFPLLIINSPLEVIEPSLVILFYALDFSLGINHSVNNVEDGTFNNVEFFSGIVHDNVLVLSEIGHNWCHILYILGVFFRSTLVEVVASLSKVFEEVSHKFSFSISVQLNEFLLIFLRLLLNSKVTPDEGISESLFSLYAVLNGDFTLIVESSKSLIELINEVLCKVLVFELVINFVISEILVELSVSTFHFSFKVFWSIKNTCGFWS